MTNSCMPFETTRPRPEPDVDTASRRAGAAARPASAVEVCAPRPRSLQEIEYEPRYDEPDGELPGGALVSTSGSTGTACSTVRSPSWGCARLVSRTGFGFGTSG
jgi:hypothetical protein